MNVADFLRRLVLLLLELPPCDVMADDEPLAPAVSFTDDEAGPRI